jgi:hypothetical protein
MGGKFEFSPHLKRGKKRDGPSGVVIPTPIVYTRALRAVSRKTEQRRDNRRRHNGISQTAIHRHAPPCHDHDPIATDFQSLDEPPSRIAAGPG